MLPAAGGPGKTKRTEELSRSSGGNSVGESSGAGSLLLRKIGHTCKRSRHGIKGLAQFSALCYGTSVVALVKELSNRRISKELCAYLTRSATLSF